MGRGFVDSVGCRVKNSHSASLIGHCKQAFTMIESTKPATDTDDKPEILARYRKALPKGRRVGDHQLKADLTVEIEQTPEGWGSVVEIECLYQFGWGETEEGALDELISTLVDVRLSLRKFKYELDPCSTRCLELLEEILS